MRLTSCMRGAGMERRGKRVSATAAASVIDNRNAITRFFPSATVDTGTPLPTVGSRPSGTADAKRAKYTDSVYNSGDGGATGSGSDRGSGSGSGSGSGRGSGDGDSALERVAGSLKGLGRLDGVDMGGRKEDDDDDDDTEVFLLLLDPLCFTSQLSKAFSDRIGWQKLVKRGLHTLVKDQYQVLNSPLHAMPRLSSHGSVCCKARLLILCRVSCWAGCRGQPRAVDRRRSV